MIWASDFRSVYEGVGNLRSPTGDCGTSERNWDQKLMRDVDISEWRDCIPDGLEAFTVSTMRLSIRHIRYDWKLTFSSRLTAQAGLKA